LKENARLELGKGKTLEEASLEKGKTTSSPFQKVLKVFNPLKRGRSVGENDKKKVLDKRPCGWPWRGSFSVPKEGEQNGTETF